MADCNYFGTLSSANSGKGQVVYRAVFLYKVLFMLAIWMVGCQFRMTRPRGGASSGGKGTT